MKNRKFTAFVIAAIAWLVFMTIAAFANMRSFEAYNDITYVGSAQYNYILIRTVEANDTPLTIDTKTWDAKLADSGWFELPSSGLSYPCISIYAHGKDGNDPNQGAFHLRMLDIREFGGAKVVFDANIGIGDAQLSRDPNSTFQLRSGLADPNYKWADEMTGLESKCSAKIYKAGYEAEDDILEIWWYAGGKRYIKPEITDCDWDKIDRIYIVLTGAGR